MDEVRCRLSGMGIEMRIQLMRKLQKRFNWLQTARSVLFLSKKTVAQRMGCSSQAITKWERREQTRDITLSELRRVADAMDCELVYFFSPIDSPQLTAGHNQPEPADQKS